MIYRETPRRLQTVEAQLETLQERMAALEEAHAQCDARIRELHAQNTDLVQLTVASQLLSGCLEREDVLATIEEVVVNMIGSEELAIFDIDSDGVSLRLARLRGVDPCSTTFEHALASVGYVTRTGKTLVTRPRGPGAESGLTAAVPLKIEGMVTGVVAIFRLLQQKPALESVDHELFEVLSRQAAMALHSASFRSLRPTVRPPPSSQHAR